MIVHRFPATWLPEREHAYKVRLSLPKFARKWVRAEYRRCRRGGVDALTARQAAIGYAVAVLGCSVTQIAPRQAVAA